MMYDALIQVRGLDILPLFLHPPINRIFGNTRNTYTRLGVTIYKDSAQLCSSTALAHSNLRTRSICGKSGSLSTSIVFRF
jgi:hypothetical protein